MVPRLVSVVLSVMLAAPVSAASHVSAMRAAPRPSASIPVRALSFPDQFKVSRGTPHALSVSPIVIGTPIPALAPATVPRVPSVGAPLGAVSLPGRLAPIVQRVALDAVRLDSASHEQASGRSEDHARYLQGAPVPGPDEDAVAPAGPSRGVAPLPPPQPRKKSVRRMIAGTMAFKLGMEGMTTAVPFVAMASLGGATAVALLVVAVYGLSQAVASSFAGALTDRFHASHLLGAAMGAQAVLVAVILGLAAAQALVPLALFGLYAGIGAAVGIAETSRRLIPPLMLGQDEHVLRQYNGRLHRFYEIAGVTGAALAGLMIWKLGALSALIATPPALLAAAWFFWGVKHQGTHRLAEQGSRPVGGPARVKAGLKSYIDDVKLAGRIVFRDPRLSALAFAMVLPQIVHRVFEGLLLPLYAKTMLGQEALSAAMLTASNFGELLGATLLLRWAARFKGPYRWVRWAAYGLAGVWALSITQALGLSALASIPVLLPLILISSLTWASSHLSLESDLQEKVAPRDQPRVFSLLFGLFVVGAALASLIVGRVLDVLPVSTAFIAVNAAFTALAAMVWLKARRLR